MQATDEDIEQFLADQAEAERGTGAAKPAVAAASGKNAFAPNAALQTGKVISINRTEVFGVPRTTMRVLMDKGGERTVHGDGASIKVALDIEVGDNVRLGQTGHLQSEWVKLVQVTERIRKKRKLFDMDVLMAPEGLPKVYEQFPLVKWDRRPNCETKALTQIVGMYKSWLFALWPKMSFPVQVDRLEKLGTKAPVRHLMTDLRYGQAPDWTLHDQEEEGKAKHKVELNQQANEIFNAYAATLQPGIKRSANAADDFDGLTDDVDDDDLMAALADKYSSRNGGAAAGATSAAAKAAAADDDSNNIHAQLAKKKAAEAARQKADDELRAAMEKSYEEEANMDVFARPAGAAAGATASTHKAKRRRVVSDDDEEEAVFAPLPPASRTQDESAGDASVEPTSAASPAASQEEVLEEDAPLGELASFLEDDEAPPASSPPPAAATSTMEDLMASSMADAMDAFLEDDTAEEELPEPPAAAASDSSSFVIAATESPVEPSPPAPASPSLAPRAQTPTQPLEASLAPTQPPAASSAEEEQVVAPSQQQSASATLSLPEEPLHADTEMLDDGDFFADADADA